MVMNIVMWVLVIWMAPLLYFILVNEAEFKKNIAVGVTFPYEGREDEEVKARLLKFKRELKWVCIFLLVIAVPCVFVRGFAGTMALWGIWIDLCIVLPYIPYVLCNRDLKRIKRARGWQRTEGEAATVTVDTSAIPDDKWLSPWLFLPPVIISLLPVIWDRGLWAVYVMFAVCPIIFWICYRYCYRNKSEAVDGNTELSRALTQVRRHNWGTMWIICAYSFAVMSIVMSLTASRPVLNTIVIVAVMFVVVAAAVNVELKTRKVQQKLTEQSGKTWYVDDDDKWIGGILYYNPNDSRNIINCRVGTNSSVNMAKPFGMILMGMCAIVLLAIPFMGVFIGSLGSNPIELELTDTAIVSTNGGTTYSVPFDEIESAELLNELPENLSRKLGTGLENLLKGKFTAKGILDLKVCLDPTCGPFIMITTKGNQHYLFGSRDTELTERVYEMLAGKIPAS